MSELTTAVHQSITAVKQGAWNAVVAQQSDTGSVFERYEWLAAHEAASDAVVRHLTVRKRGTLVGVHPAVARSELGTPFRFLGPPKPGTNGAMITTVFDAVADEMASSTGCSVAVGRVILPIDDVSVLSV